LLLFRDISRHLALREISLYFHPDLWILVISLKHSRVLSVFMRFWLLDFRVLYDFSCFGIHSSNLGSLQLSRLPEWYLSWDELRARVTADMSAHPGNISRWWKLPYNGSDERHWLMESCWKVDATSSKIKKLRRLVYGSRATKVLQDSRDAANCRLAKFTGIRSASRAKSREFSWFVPLSFLREQYEWMRTSCGSLMNKSNCECEVTS